MGSSELRFFFNEFCPKIELVMVRSKGEDILESVFLLETKKQFLEKLQNNVSCYLNDDSKFTCVSP